MVIDTYTASVLAHGSMYYQVGTVAAQVHQWIAGLEKATEPKKGDRIVFRLTEIRRKGIFLEFNYEASIDMRESVQKYK